MGVGVDEDWLATTGCTVCPVAAVAQKHNARKSNMAISALVAHAQDSWFGLIPIASIDSSVQLASMWGNSVAFLSRAVLSPWGPASASPDLEVFFAWHRPR
jgi:hypothetical protein